MLFFQTNSQLPVAKEIEFEMDMHTRLYLKWVTRPYCRHRELCSASCGRLDGRGVWGRTGIYIWMAESLRCSPETTTTLFVGCTPIQNKKFKKSNALLVMPPKITQSSVQPRGSAHVPLTSSGHTPPSPAVTVRLPRLTHGSSFQPHRDPPDTPSLTTLLSTTTRSFPPSIHAANPAVTGLGFVISQRQTHTRMRRPRIVCHTNHHTPVLGPRSALGRKSLSERLSETQQAPE